MFDSPTLASIVTTCVVAYTLGALPAAYVAGRLRGVNVFEAGTRQAGATNVWRLTSRRTGLTVFFFDAGKGLAAVLIAKWLGLTGAWALLAGAAVVLGHWNSVFTRFKGGDGVSTWAGVVFGIAPIISIPPFVLVALIRWRLGSKLAHPTYWGALTGSVLFLGLSFVPVAGIGVVHVFGVTGLGAAVMAHSMAFHRRHSAEIPEPADATEEANAKLGSVPSSK